MCRRPTVLRGKDDQGVRKTGFLWKRTSSSFRKWKPHLVVVSRFCLLCFKGENSNDVKGLRCKVDLHRVNSVEVEGKKRNIVAMVTSEDGIVRLKCSNESEAQEWRSIIAESADVCAKRQRLFCELNRAAFMRHVEKNLQQKMEMHLRKPNEFQAIPRVTLLRRVSSMESLLPQVQENHAFTIQNRCFSLEEILFKPVARKSFSRMRSPHVRKRHLVQIPPLDPCQLNVGADLTLKISPRPPSHKPAWMRWLTTTWESPEEDVGSKKLPCKRQWARSRQGWRSDFQEEEFSSESGYSDS